MTTETLSIHLPPPRLCARPGRLFWQYPRATSVPSSSVTRRPAAPLEVFLVYPGCMPSGSTASPTGCGGTTLSSSARWLSQVCPRSDRHRDPPRGHHRSGLLHRPRHGGRHRRDGRDRRGCDPLPRRDPGRHQPGERQAPPHPGRPGGGRRGCQDAGRHHHRGRQPHRRQRGRGQVRARPTRSWSACRGRSSRAPSSSCHRCCPTWTTPPCRISSASPCASCWNASMPSKAGWRAVSMHRTSMPPAMAPGTKAISTSNPPRAKTVRFRSSGATIGACGVERKL